MSGVWLLWRGSRHFKTSNPEPRCQSWPLLPVLSWQFVPIFHQPRAIKPALSAVLSAGHRRRVSLKWGSRDTLSRLVPPHTGNGAALGPLCLAPESASTGNAGANAGRHSAKLHSNFPSGRRWSHWHLRIRLRICSEWFVLSCPPISLSSSLTQVLVLCSKHQAGRSLIERKSCSCYGLNLWKIR